jgi:hypothetical protein
MTRFSPGEWRPRCEGVEHKKQKTIAGWRSALVTAGAGGPLSLGGRGAVASERSSAIRVGGWNTEVAVAAPTMGPAPTMRYRLRAGARKHTTPSAIAPRGDVVSTVEHLGESFARARIGGANSALRGSRPVLRAQTFRALGLNAPCSALKRSARWGSTLRGSTRRCALRSSAVDKRLPPDGSRDGAAGTSHLLLFLAEGCRSSRAVHR